MSANLEVRSFPPSLPAAAGALRTSGSVRVIVMREMHEHLLNPVVWGLGALAMVIAVFATRVGLQDLHTRHRVYEGLLAQRQQDRARIGDQVVGWQLDPALRVLRPPQSASAIVRGLDTGVPQFWDFGPAGTRSGHRTADADLDGTADLEFVIRVILGLLAIILAVESTAGDRSSGALLAILGQPVRPGVVLSGKLLGGAATLAICTVVPVAAALLTAVVVEPARVTTTFVGALFGVAGAGWLYLFTFFAFGVLVSILVQSYRAAMTTAVTIWLLGGATGLAIPRVAARSAFPALPASFIEEQGERILQERRRRVQIELGDAYVRLMPPGATLLNGPEDAARQPAVAGALQPIWDRHLGALAGDLARLREDRARARSRQRAIATLLSVLSPGAQFSAAASNLAATGEAAARRWESAAQTFQGALQQALFSNPARWTIFVPAPPRRGPAAEGRWIVSLTRRSPPAIGSLPAFAGPESGAATRLGDAAGGLARLALGAALFIAIANRAFARLRFDLR
jgi:hypothetical protein